MRENDTRYEERHIVEIDFLEAPTTTLCNNSPIRYSSITSTASANSNKQIAPIDAIVIKKFSSNILPRTKFFTVLYKTDHPDAT